MNKILALAMMFMGSVYGMDKAPAPQKQGQQPDLKNLSREPGTEFSRTPDDLFPLIESYRAAKHELQKLQEKLNNAQSLNAIINLGETNDEYKLAPLHLDLRMHRGVNEKVIKKITDLFPNLEALLLYGPSITDGVLPHLKDLTNLTELELSYSGITDAGLVHLKDLSNLKILWLSVKNITAVGLAHLKGLTNLKKLSLVFLPGSKVRDTAVDDLREALPNCEIKVQ